MPPKAKATVTKEEDATPKSDPASTSEPVPAAESAPTWLTALLEAQSRREDILVRALADLKGSSSTESTTQRFHRSPALTLPSKLQTSVSLREFRIWRSAWDDYAKLSHAGNLKNEEQVAEFRMCLSDSMREVVQHAIGVADGDDVDAILDKIDAHLRSQKNIAIDRARFEERRQQEAEPFDAFLVALKQLSADAELCKVCIDERLTTRIMTGIRDARVRRKLLATKPFPNLIQAVNICRSEEAAIASDAELTGSMPLAIQSATGTRAETSGQDTACPKCGDPSHISTQICPADSKDCHYCGIRGHFSKACRKRIRRSIEDRQRSRSPSLTRRRTPSPNYGGGRGQTTHMRQVISTAVSVRGVRPHLRAPTVSVTLEIPPGDCRRLVEATPDSGAELTVMGPSLLSEVGMSPSQLAVCELEDVVAANGQTMTYLGSFNTTISLQEASTQETVHVFREVRGMLISWYTAKNLGILQPQYPHPCPPANQGAEPATSSNTGIGNHKSPESMLHTRTLTSGSQDPVQMKKILLDEFADVFSEDGTLQTMIGEPMKIHLQENARPHAVRAARKIPFAWREQVKQELESMVHRGIIEPVGDEPSEWCHPLVIVPKTKGLRIVIDFTKLNDFVRRPTHPLVTPKDAVSSVPPGSRFFTTVDAASGYSGTGSLSSVPAGA